MSEMAAPLSMTALWSIPLPYIEIIMRGARTSGKTAVGAGVTAETRGPGLRMNGRAPPGGRITAPVNDCPAAFAVTPAVPAAVKSVYAISLLDMFRFLADPAAGAIRTDEGSIFMSSAVRARTHRAPPFWRKRSCSGATPIDCQSAVPLRNETMIRAVSSEAAEIFAIPTELGGQKPNCVSKPGLDTWHRGRIRVRPTP